MWEEIGEYIIKNNNLPLNIIEIGIGKYYDISDYLSNKNEINIKKIDINPSRKDIIQDDISQPNMKLYENADIIYSIRPPYEIQPYLIDLAEKLNCELIIKPLTGETLHSSCFKMKLINYKKISFYTNYKKTKGST